MKQLEEQYYVVISGGKYLFTGCRNRTPKLYTLGGAKSVISLEFKYWEQRCEHFARVRPNEPCPYGKPSLEIRPVEIRI